MHYFDNVSILGPMWLLILLNTFVDCECESYINRAGAVNVCLVFCVSPAVPVPPVMFPASLSSAGTKKKKKKEPPCIICTQSQ